MASRGSANTNQSVLHNNIDMELGSVGVGVGVGGSMRPRNYTSDSIPSPHKNKNRNSLLKRGSTDDTSCPVMSENTLQAIKEEPNCWISKIKRGLGFKKVETQPATFKQLSIDPQKEIDEYAKNEWMTTLPNALKMKEGYRRVKEEGYGHIRRIRGDNYCALRSVMFQTLTSCDVKKSILTRFSEETALKRLEELRGEYGGLIDEWKFGTNSFLREGNGNSRYKSLQACIKTFYDMVRKLGGKPPRERRDLLVTEMNKEEVHRFATDAKLVECIKFFMFSYAEKLYKKLATGKDVPLWFTLLTLRGNSSSLQEYFQEQLNNVGDSLGLEQVEMCLLSTSLNAKIKVFRLSSVDKDDFQTRYPSEESAEGTQLQEIVLCAEDDRHYNVVYKL